MKEAVRQDFEELREFYIQGCPVIVTETFIFMGPKMQPGCDCFRCMYEDLKDHKSIYAKMMDSSLNHPAISQLSKVEREYLERIQIDLTQRLMVVSRYNLSVELVPVHCHPLHHCNRIMKDFSLQKIDSEYVISLDHREKNGDDIFCNDNVELLLNEHAGIGAKLVRDANSKIIPMYFVKSNLLKSEYYSYGRAENAKKSRMSALFEMLERYSSIVPHNESALAYSYHDMVKNGYVTLSPEKLNLNKPDDDMKALYGFGEYDRDQVYYWNKAVNLLTDEEIYIPEQTIYYDGQLVRDEKRYLYETSNGTALGGSFEEAVVYALLEVVERDSFMMHWYNRVAPKHLDLSGIKNQTLLNIITYMECMGIEIHVMDITMETKIPTIWIAAVDTKNQHAIKCYNAAGAHFDPEKALEAALVEVVTSFGVYEEIIKSGAEDARMLRLKGHPEEVKQMEDHVYFYASEENFHWIEDYYKNPVTCKFTENFKDWYLQDKHEYKMKDLIDRFREYYQNIYICLLDNMVNRNLGLWCVKAIVPEMLTMTFGVKNQRINVERIQRGAVKANIRETEIKEELINMIPHPFP